MQRIVNHKTKYVYKYIYKNSRRTILYTAKQEFPDDFNSLFQFTGLISCHNVLDSLVGVQQVADGGIVI